MIRKLLFVTSRITPVIKGAKPAPMKLAKFWAPPIMPKSCGGDISATRAHVGEILSPRQKIVMPMTQTITKISSIKGITNIDIEAIRQPVIIGVKRETMTEKPFLIIKSEIIPPSITEAMPEINDAEVAILISDKLKFFTFIK